MTWIAPSEKDTAAATLKKRPWDTADQFRAKSGLKGQAINPETYAICKADMLLKGEGESADHLVGGAEHSALSHDAFPAQEFDFMLANPPYGKSWKKDLETIGGKDGVRDPRFKVMHQGDELSLVTRSSDGRMLFLANMAAKMNHDTPLGSRIAEVHNGSSLFTGDAGQGESNIRRWLIENDWLEAIVALPSEASAKEGIEGFIRREVLPYTPDAWIKADTPRSATKSASRATSISRSPCAPSRKSAPTSSPYNRKPRACSMSCSREARHEPRTPAVIRPHPLPDRGRSHPHPVLVRG